ncbi:hypothetical protein [uncultured Sphingomonas sp.]|uniref:hypothetical protein n=1 Tax=uncultured Sphingomonas sp. TaxID=158754 RepID=UPI00262C809E|nr:hypothetical protein [uncultured Sphingomonas sp.]
MVTALALLRRFWWAIPIIGLTLALLVTRETLADRTATLSAERQAWTAEIERAERQRAEIEKRNADRISQATATYADRLAAREPIILRSTNTVREYATTDAGRLRCRGADRVRAIDALDAELADPAPPTGSSPSPVPAHAPAPAG